MNTFPRWKYILLLVIVLVSLIYALPNIYGEDPAVQITGLKGAEVSDTLLKEITTKLQKEKLNYKSISIIDKNILIRFLNTEIQLKAKDLIKSWLAENYSVALNLAPVTPCWLEYLGAKPMKLGLDLRGGVRFLMEVDVAASIARGLETSFLDLRGDFRKENIRYKSFAYNKENSLLLAVFKDEENRDKAYSYIRKNYIGFDIVSENEAEEYLLKIYMNNEQITEIRNYTIEQTITTLRNRVNELGVAEAIVQRQGLNRVVVELPGIQDTARAKDILGRTATLDFVMVDHEGDLNKALRGQMPPGSRVLYERHGRPVLIKKRVILTGDAITGASSGFDSQSGGAAVSVKLGNSGIGLFKQTTMNNIGKGMAVIYRETKVNEKILPDGEIVKEKVTTEDIISVATIQGALGNRFQITGLNMEEARDLALLLRAGALPATISIVEERVIGPSMGQENIRMGMISVGVGLGLVLIFMAIYYSVFGIIANIALLFNLILLVAVMSLIGATLTLPGIAGIVLTLGMAVDANVLIFERIREELKSGMTIQASIYRGFDHAFATIVDANVTTLIAGIILFAVGTGPVKGFAITLSIGILTSMFTAVTGSRAIVNLLYGKKTVKKLLIGI